MILKHMGHSEFLMTTAAGYRVLTDPYDDHVGYAMNPVMCDAVLVSHGHGDHSYVDKAQNAQVTVREAGVFTLAEGISVEGIPAWHDDQQGAQRGPNMIYVLSADGLRVAHMGDLGAWDEELVRKIGRVDVALMPVGGYYTMPVEQACAFLRCLAPRMVIPMHYRTAVNASWPIAPLETFLEAYGAKDAPHGGVLRVTKEDLSQQPAVFVLDDLCSAAAAAAK